MIFRTKMAGFLLSTVVILIYGCERAIIACSPRQRSYMVVILPYSHILSQSFHPQVLPNTKGSTQSTKTNS